MDLTQIKKNLKEEYPGLKISIIDEIAEQAEREVEDEDRADNQD